MNHNESNSIIDAMKTIQDKMNEMISRSNIDLFQLNKGNMKHTLFDSLFIYENYPHLARKDDRAQDLLKFEKQYDVEKLDYPLTVVVHETSNKECLQFVLNYAGELFDDCTINDLLDVTNELLTQIAYKRVTQISQLNLLPMKQLNQINQWNNTDKEFPLNKQQTTIHQLFEEEAEKSPDKLAVVYEDIQLTYEQLNDKANQLAHHIRSICDIYPDDLIALLLDKSELMIVSILGVWKSGAAYVPIDPSYPDERIQFILEDTRAKVIITNKKYMSRLYSYHLIKIEIESTSSALNDEKNSRNPQPISFNRNLAYVIYTSGTTGKPKGVMIEHTGVINLEMALTDLFQLKSRPESVLSFSNYVFDHFVEQMTYALLNSQVLVILNDELRVDKPRLYQYLNKNKVTYLSGTPSVLQEYDYSQLNHLIRIDAAGEDLSEIIFNKIRSKFNGLIINGYGPTEISITSHMKLYYLYEKRINKSIGEPLMNVKCYVLDSYLNQLPIGAVGELYIGGIGVARGYLNRPELTTERFLPNPFQTQQEKNEGKNARIYKTGDLVRWLPDGELEYLGRNDFQIKIRGLRIELGEIETVLSSYQGIKQSVVIARDAKTTDTEGRRRKYLLGYYVSDNDISEVDLKQFMQTKLPVYMIPNRLIHIEKVPVTINGKLDARALPEIDFAADENNYVAPRNELEEKLCEIWSHLLGIEKIGIKDDFFRLGGDSISSLQLIGRIRKELSLSISVKDVFVFKTVENLCENVLENDFKQKIINSNKSNSDEQGTLTGEVPLLPIQEWFFLQHFASLNHWNQSFLIETPLLDLSKLNDSLIKLIDYHDAFKLRFKHVDHNKYIQYYDSSGTTTKNFLLNHLNVLNLDHGENREQSLNTILTGWQNQFNIENGPLFAVGYLVGFPDGKARIWFGIHHLIVDVVSWRIICKDLEHLYNNSSYLGRKGSSYRQWSQLIQSYAVRHSATEGIYWHCLLNNVLSFNDNFNKHNIICNNKLSMITTNVTLDSIQTSSLLRDCPHAYNAKINVLLLTALGYALKGLTQSRINCVTLEGHGREDIDGENINISQTVGWFTTMYPIILEIDDDLCQSIINIKEYLMRVPNNGIGYGTIIGYNTHHLPRISFNYLGQFEAASSTKTSNEWYLIDGIVGEEVEDNQTQKSDSGDVITVNGFCMKGQIRFNIKSQLDSERTTQFANTFNSKLEEIIQECSRNKVPNPKDYSKDFEHPFVVFNENFDNILFILPPGEGGAESYFNNIVPHLSQYKLVIFNNFYLELKAKTMEQGFSFETLAHLYIKYIKEIQLNGPYNFVGWSFGGVLSFEISRQLNNAGDKVDNIFMIDSYFDVRKAFLEIGKIDKINIIDSINYSYLPMIDKEPFGLSIANRNTNIVLFKATKVEEDYISKDQLELFTYYSNTSFNNLNVLVNHNYIQLFQMHGDSHFSWVFNKEQIINICNYIASVL